MKKTSIRLVFALAFSAMLFTACKKDKDEAGPEINKTNLAGKYKLSKLEMIPPAGSAQSMMGTLDECEKDDAYTLNADFSAKFEDLGSTCSQTTVRTTTWKLEGKNIQIDGGSQEFIGVVKSYDGKTLVIDGSYDFMGITTTLRATLAKQ